MSKHGMRLVNGVRELILTEDTCLEDLHMVASDLVLTIDKIAMRTVKKLKEGQRIRCYEESSNKEYGIRGSDVVCFFKNMYETQAQGPKMKVYDETGKEWGVGIDCLLEIYESFDPQSELGGKQPVVDISKIKKRGRKSNKELQALEHQKDFDANPWDSLEAMGEDEFNPNYEDFFDE